MGDSEWGFFLDENVGREVATQLTQRGYHADLVIDVLEPGVADHSEILPYAREHGLIVVTKDCSDFSALPPSEHEGLILVANHAHSPVDLAAAIDTLVDTYPSRSAFRGQEEFIDDWVSH
ncbi:DUF5615 family PIN-like protein [Halonotius roseus]|uniref:DUF5615 domain-containing protein n=1 Tax=Halonotius roseus TaxID=2511997 RepID=A0A544QPN3_9EURY|nr:DUF5615 family PIN-like protein [Halonotius roseus]TQQ81389.1 hypothetical protein EWF95_00120 [Halonotius roseus]